MPLERGATLGPYRIEAPLGAGGMGEVYKAHDARLDRAVAIKVLPAHVAADPDLRQRFEREAKTIAALNHPHICTLHDIGRDGETDFLVMEYLEGETVVQRLERGPLPLDEALAVAVAIADALDKAHRQGIVHRDLKPGNIMLTRSGAKLLDFGLAKLRPAEPAGGMTALPTREAPITAQGTILGTFQYMAPEQLEGREADARTDIFAFGATVYEMVTGEKAFTGTSQASLISAIMSGEPPPISSRQALSPPALDRIVATCLAKDAERRWQSAGDVGRQLMWIRDGGSRVGVPVAVGASRRTRQWLAGAVAGGAVTAALAALAVWGLAPAGVARPAVRLSVTLPAESPAVFPGSPTSALAISPDGSTLVYVGRSPGFNTRLVLYVRNMADREVRPLTGTDGAAQPFFRPDGRWVAFFTGDGELRKVSLDGGQPVTLANDIASSGWAFGSWGDDDTIVFSVPLQGLSRVSADGGTPEVVTTVDPTRRESYHAGPQFVPGAPAVLFGVVPSDAAPPQVDVVDLRTGDRRVVLENALYPLYAASGHLVFKRDDILMAAPFDRDRIEITGPAVPLVERVAFDTLDRAPQLALSRTGTLAYLPPAPDANATLMWVNRQGRVDELDTPPRPYREARLSPDGTRVAVWARAGPNESHVYVYDVTRDVMTRMTRDGRNMVPVWTPDGTRIVYGSRGERAGLYWQPVDGSAPADLLVESDGNTIFYPGSWSPDGRHLAYMRQDASGEDIHVLSLDPEPTSAPFVDGPARESNPIFSPDGRWLAYVSNESGDPEVYLRRYPDGETRTQVSRGGGLFPVWSPDGTELFFAGADQSRGAPVRGLQSVSIATDPELRVGTPTLLLAVPFPGVERLDDVDYLDVLPQIGSNWGVGYGVAPDGDRFLMIRPTSAAPPNDELMVVLDWLEELKARVPPS